MDTGIRTWVARTNLLVTMGHVEHLEPWYVSMYNNNRVALMLISYVLDLRVKNSLSKYSVLVHAHTYAYILVNDKLNHNFRIHYFRILINIQSYSIQR